jgi:hypothetical protein
MDLAMSFSEGGSSFFIGDDAHEQSHPNGLSTCKRFPERCLSIHLSTNVQNQLSSSCQEKGNEGEDGYPKDDVNHPWPIEKDSQPEREAQNQNCPCDDH